MTRDSLRQSFGMVLQKPGCLAVLWKQSLPPGREDATDEGDIFLESITYV